MSVAAPALIVAAAGVGFGHAVMPDHWLPLATVGRVRGYAATRVLKVSALAGLTHVIVSLVLGAIVVAVGLQFRASIEHAQDLIAGGLLLATGIVFGVLELTGHGHHHGHSHVHPGEAALAHEHGHEHLGHEHVHPHDHVHGHEHTHDHGDGHDHAHDHDHGDAHDHDHGHEHDHTHTHGHEHPSGRSVGLLGLLVPFGAAASPDLTILPVFLAAAAAGTTAAVSTLVAFAIATVGTIVVLTLLAFLSGWRLQGHWLDRWGNAFTALVLIVIGLLVITGTV